MEQKALVEALKTCDYIFLAADRHRAPRLFKAIIHQYLIPGVQLGTQIRTDRDDGSVVSVHTSTRLVTPSSDCLVCNEAISSIRFGTEA